MCLQPVMYIISYDNVTNCINTYYTPTVVSIFSIKKVILNQSHYYLQIIYYRKFLYYIVFINVLCMVALLYYIEYLAVIVCLSPTVSLGNCSRSLSMNSWNTLQFEYIQGLKSSQSLFTFLCANNILRFPLSLQSTYYCFFIE